MQVYKSNFYLTRLISLLILEACKLTYNTNVSHILSPLMLAYGMILMTKLAYN